MTTPSLTHIDTTADEIHSHDVIDRIAELERRRAAAEAEGEPFDAEDASELCDLVDLELQCASRARGAWRSGMTLHRWEPWPLPGVWIYEDVDFAGVTYALRVG